MKFPSFITLKDSFFKLPFLAPILSSYFQLILKQFLCNLAVFHVVSFVCIIGIKSSYMYSSIFNNRTASIQGVRLAISTGNKKERG